MIIIQLLKDTKYPANYQIIIDSSLGNYAVLRDFFSALQTGRDVAESHREDAAGKGRRGGEPSGRCCRQGTPWWRAIGKMLPAKGAVAQRAARNPGQMITT